MPASFSPEKAPPRILIMGVGNVLLCDEGFGVRAVATLRNSMTGRTMCSSWPARPAASCSCRRSSPAICWWCWMWCWAAKRPERSIYSEIARRKSLSFRDSMHQTDLLDTLATCELAGHRPEAVAFGLQPFDYHSMTMNISPQAEAMLPTFCRKVVEELARRGICATPAFTGLLTPFVTCFGERKPLALLSMPVRLLRRPGLLTKILLTISTDTKSTYPVCPEKRCAPRPCFFPLIKAGWGRDGGLGGKGNTSRADGDRKAAAGRAR